MLLVVTGSSYSSDEDGVDNEDEDWIGIWFRGCSKHTATGASFCCCCCCCVGGCETLSSANATAALASDGSAALIVVLVLVTVVAIDSESTSVLFASGCDSPSFPVPMLLTRDDGESDETVVGDDDDEGEISTNVDSSSSSAAAAADEFADAVGIVDVAAATSVLVAFVGSMLIFWLAWRVCVLVFFFVTLGLSQPDAALLIHWHS